MEGLTRMVELSDGFSAIFEQIKQDPQNISYTQQGVEPLYYADSEARLLIVGQAPGQRAQDTRIVWNDASGNRLRDWLGTSRKVFYNSGKIAIVPMDFYFPGSGKSGDLPPRKGFAEKWHPLLLQSMPKIELTILVGAYAAHHYLGLRSSVKLTDIVRNYRDYLPNYFPLVHPSPRNQIWIKKHPWFAEEVLPDLKSRVQAILDK